MKQRTLSIATAALLLVSSGAVSAALDCGYDIPDCLTVTLEKRQVWIERNCGYPNAIRIDVESGLGSVIAKNHDGMRSGYIGEPIDTDPENPAYYAEASCCEGTDYSGTYSCAPDQLPTGVVRGE